MSRRRFLHSSYFHNKQHYSSWSSLTSSPVFGYDRRRQEQQRIPRISLQQPLSLHYFSADTNDKSGEHHTLRERIHERQEQGKEAAKQGAKSAKSLIQKYGPAFVGTYLTVYVSTVAALFVGVESGVLDPAMVLSYVSDGQEAKSTVEVITEFMSHYPWMEGWAPVIKNKPQIANLAVAWIATKFTEPVRLALTIAIVPKISRTFGFAQPKSEKSADGSSTVEQETHKVTEESSSKEEMNDKQTPAPK